MKIADNVFMLDSTNGSYVYLIKDKETVLIDTSRKDKKRGILRDLNCMNIDISDIKHILLTHHDTDHVGNVQFLQKESKCKVWASKEDFPYISGKLKRPGIKRIIEAVVRAGIPESINIYNENEKICGIDVIHTPGHTPGHVCLFYKGILFAGDLFKVTKGRIEPFSPFWNWNTDMLMNSIKKIKNLPIKWICPAHGIPIAVSEENLSESLKKYKL